MTLVTILINFMALHWLDVLLFLVFLGVLTWMWRKGKKATVIRIIRSLVTKAEQLYGSKTGPIKKNEVYARLPWLIRTIWTQTELEKFIDDAVAWLNQQLLQYEANLLTYAEEKQLEVFDSIEPFPIPTDEDQEDP